LEQVKNKMEDGDKIDIYHMLHPVSMRRWGDTGAKSDEAGWAIACHRVTDN